MNITGPNQKSHSKLVESLKEKGLLFSEDERLLSNLLKRKRSILKRQDDIIKDLHRRLKKVD